MRWMALDHGTRRIGIAFCDPGETVATPYAVWPNEGPKTVARLAALAAEEGAEGIVVGLPQHDDGNDSGTAPAARALAAALEPDFAGPVVLRGEHLTTVEADRRMAEAGLPSARRTAMRDAFAAAALLEDFLSARPGETT